MSYDQHIRTDHYVLVREGRSGPGALALQVHQHLVQVCRDCNASWRLLGEGQEPFRDLLLDVPLTPEGPSDGDAPPPPHHQTAYSWEARRVEEEVERIRRIQGEAGKRCWELLHMEPEERPERVRRAWTRFRSRAEAEYLLGKARDCIREDPREAESLAATAELIAKHIPGTAGTAWGTELRTRAIAWRANALRVAGDLPASNQLFVQLRRELATAPLDSAAVIGEIASLEASLRIDQRLFDEAQQLLELAQLVAEVVGDEGLGRKVLVQQGHLHALLTRDAEALACFERAAAIHEGEEDGSMHLAVVNGRVGSLCDLGRHREAEQLLDEHLDLYETSDQVYSGAILRYHRGRIALGLERWDEAARHLKDAREVFLDLDRSYDALLATLDLAWVLAHGSRVRELRTLAASLVPLFYSQQVRREALAAVRLLVEAVEDEKVSAQRIATLRARLRREFLHDSAMGDVAFDS